MVQPSSFWLIGSKPKKTDINRWRDSCPMPLAGVPNHIMGEGPIPASQRALANAGLSVEDMDVVESNEAFAAQALAVAKGLNLDMDKTNPNGGAIALGHPVGCSGAFIATKALYELQRINGRYALVTMCIGGGQGIACVFENL